MIVIRLNIRRIDYRHYICALITLLFVLLAVFVYRPAMFRIAEAFCDFGTSIAFYICTLFQIKNKIVPTTTKPSSVDFPIMKSFDEFKISFVHYWQTFADENNFAGYLNTVAPIIVFVVSVLGLIITIAIVIFKAFSKSFYKPNNNYGKESKPLIAFKFITKKAYVPTKNWMREFISFLQTNNLWLKAWLMIWLLNLNILSLVLELSAFISYFAMSFDVANIVFQLYKLALDLSMLFGNLPIVIWIIFGLLIFDYLRKKCAYSVLEHFERMNRGLINSFCIVIMLVGTMGKKKTTLLTDIALSQEIMFRNIAFEKILENDLKFSHFPWINLEIEIKKAMENHQVYNLATIKKFMNKKRARWIKEPCTEKLFGYDYETYGLYYDNKLYLENIWDVLKTYAQLYFIYIIESSLLISNYSIRTDNILENMGNFPLWNSDFFRRDSRLIDSYSRHAHILDFDSLRLGKQIVENNKYADSLEFGVICITEIGKERGNNLENRGKEKKSAEANQCNDLFNYSLKMARHKATVDNYPFIKIITDEQRPESWGADARDLCEIIHIEDCWETRLAMPFFSLEEMICEWLYEKLSNVYTKFRFNRGDSNLIVHLIESLRALVKNHYIRIYNRFGYMKINLAIEQGTQDGKMRAAKYHLMIKKNRAKRFSTDCFSDVFEEKSLRSQIGINDLPEFATERASFEEMQQENSYFFNDLMNIRDKNNRL